MTTSEFGTTIKVKIYGESHSAKIGCSVEGFPLGFKIDKEKLNQFLIRRASSHNPWDTPRHELDIPYFVSGVSSDGIITDSTIKAEIDNTSIRPSDYQETEFIPRPGHADFAAWAKWGDNYKHTGGGHFSARLTAPLCVAGGIALQILQTQKISVVAHVSQIKDIKDVPFELIDNSLVAHAKLLSQISQLQETTQDTSLPFISKDVARKTKTLLTALRKNKETTGGKVECVVIGLPAGIGNPHFQGLENVISTAIFGIPAVKGIEFGSGMNAATLTGSENNDAYVLQNGKVVPKTNHAGGILGGISTGAPLWFTCAFKPISSIGIPQQSVNLKTLMPTTITIHGRHDVTAVLRAIPCVESACALALLDTLYTWPSQRKRNE